MTRRVRSLLAACLVVLAVGAQSRAVSARLTAGERGALTAYLQALQRGDFAAAFSQLSPDERRYYRSFKNLRAVFAADRLRLGAFTILESVSTPHAGTVAVVRERVTFFDHAHQQPGTLTANVRYGIVRDRGSSAVKDPFHPWFAFAPPDVTASVGGVRVSVRKLSFYTGRLEVLATFANTGDATVTLLPYGRSVVLDDGGAAHTPVRSKLAGLTDATLFGGLRLPPNARYTGSMTFFTADRFVPKRLGITFAPALLDGADSPFELKLPDIDVPARA